MKKHDNNILNSSVHGFFCFNFQVSVFYFVCPTRRIHFFLLMVHKSKQKFRPNPIIYREILFVSVFVFMPNQPKSDRLPEARNDYFLFIFIFILFCLFLFILCLVGSLLSLTYFCILNQGCSTFCIAKLVKFDNFKAMFKTIFDDKFDKQKMKVPLKAM